MFGFALEIVQSGLLLQCKKRQQLFLLVTFCVATLRFCLGLLFETAIRFLTAD